MALEGIVRDVKGLFTHQAFLELDFYAAQEAVHLGIDLLAERIRRKEFDPRQATTVYVRMLGGIDTMIGEHPLRFRSWRRVKLSARILKENLTDAYTKSMDIAYRLPDRLRRLYPDEQEQRFLYEEMPAAKSAIIIQPNIDIPLHAREIYRLARELARQPEPQELETRRQSLIREAREYASHWLRTRAAAALITIATMLGTFADTSADRYVVWPHQALKAMQHTNRGLVFPEDVGH